MAYHEYFPEEFIQLNRELIRHPRLQQLLSKHKGDDFVMRMLEIAAYSKVEVPMQEMGMPEFIELAGVCLEQLKRLPPIPEEKSYFDEKDWSLFIEKEERKASQEQEALFERLKKKKS